jgi:tetraprenyl-beta-curcumene synthase
VIRHVLEDSPAAVDRGDRPPGSGRARLALDRRSPSVPASRRHGVGHAGAFSSNVVRYARTVFPVVTAELAHWRARALEIPDPFLRRLAADAAAKRGNMEGAALFAVLAPPALRVEATRALVAFQSAYNYLDALAEQPGPDPEENARQLHGALLVALDRGAPHLDYYARCPHRDDGGYLAGMVDTCRGALILLPSYGVAGPTARTAAARIVDFQSLNLNQRQGGQAGLARWARDETPAGSGLRWWETAAAAGSSLAVHALIGSAAREDLDAGDVEAIDRAYFPWIGALHSLLDSLVDLAEDRRAGQRSLLSYYSTPQITALRLSLLAARARSAAGELPSGAQHDVILTAMASHYLSAPEVATRELYAISGAAARAAGPLVSPLLPLFRAGRLASGFARRAYGPLS